jgi:tRNA(fMet)-specific endonuclease VapC
MHIAGHARSKGLVLVTNNVEALERLPALELKNWVNTA